MNYLAHALLAGPNPETRLGGLLGDFVKGPLESTDPRLSRGVVAGIALHRRIDSYADAHAAFRLSRQRVSPIRRRYAGIITDMFYDHFLARHWSTFCEQPLESFADQTYSLLEQHHDLLPPRLARALPHMREDDWLSSYRDVASIGVALDRMSAYRLRRSNTLSGGASELLADYAAYESDFLEFLPDALAFAALWQTGDPPSVQFPLP